MHLLIFDIDGTLSNTTHADDKCYLQELNNCFGINLSTERWMKYKAETTGTDEGLITAIYRGTFGKNISTEELMTFKNKYIKALQKASQQHPEQFREVEGSTAMLNQLSQKQNFAIAIATGCWQDTAELKLNAIGINPNKFPLSCSDNTILRYHIVKNAIEKAQTKYLGTIPTFEKITYIGDGIWDYITSQYLNINFVGVDSQKNGKLQEHGVKKIIQNFLDIETFLDLISTRD